MSGTIQQNVVRLEISMNNPIAMKKSEAANDLCSEESYKEIEKINVKHFVY